MGKNYFCTMRDMAKEDRVHYDAPAMLVLEVKTEGLVCQSVEWENYGDAIEI